VEEDGVGERSQGEAIGKAKKGGGGSAHPPFHWYLRIARTLWRGKGVGVVNQCPDI
jgi:hypothetical protein